VKKASKEKKKVIKRKIDLNVLNSLDKDLKDNVLEFYTDKLIEQEQRNRNSQITLAKKVFNTKRTLVKDLGDNDTEREEMLVLVSSFPTTQPTTEKGWSRVLGIMDRKGSKKSKRNVEFPISKSKPQPKKSPAKPKTPTKKK
tara:strand:+ start:99 stop:524 length:426 start_codon:yes stop_codon:yes gene_type:complete